MEERGQRAAFEARLASRWGPALDLFDLTVEQAVDAGRWINAGWRLRSARRQDQKFEALIRLHGRAVMTAYEVLVLLRAGYSTGALARWRTIHEIWIVFCLLGDHNQYLSRRYLVHDAVETMKAEKDYEETWQALGFEPPDWQSAERDQLRAQLSGEFGEAFLQDYGWAAPLFEGRSPRIKQLQELAALGHWRGYYRMASHGTHANPKGISWNIQAGGQKAHIIWSGPSNAGLVDPAQCTLIALANITVGLLRYAADELMTEDQLVEQGVALVRQQAVLMLMDAAIDSFGEALVRQEQEEEELGELIDRATTILNNQPLLTAEQLAEILDLEVGRLEEALEAAVGRGQLAADRRYFLMERPEELDTGGIT